MKKNKLLIALGIVIVGCVICSFVFWGRSKKVSNKVAVGVVLPLTGEVSNYGIQMLNGAKLWADLHPDSNLNLVAADGKGIASVSVNALNKLAMADGIVACISGFSAPTLAMVPMASRNKVLLLNAGAVNPQIKRGGKYVFSLIPDAEVEADYIAKFLARAMKRLECYIYWQNDDSGKGMLDVFKKSYVDYGGKICGTEGFQPQEIKNSLAKIRVSGVDTVFIPANGDNIAKVIRQAYSMGLTNILWVGYGGAESPSLCRELKDFSNVKLIFSTYAFDNVSGKNERSRNFIDAYRSKFGETPAYYSATCYDAMELLSRAINNGCYTSDTIADFINSVGVFNGVSGEFTIPKGANYVTAGLSFKQFKNGAIVELSKMDFLND